MHADAATDRYLRHMETFLAANPGMARRVAFQFHFEDFRSAPSSVSFTMRLEVRI